MENKKSVIGIIGAGRLGTAVARQSIKAGYTVFIANSRTPETLTLMLSVLLPDAHAATVPEVIKESDVIVLAMPLHRYTTLVPELFTGKIVIDAMNYWPQTEGNIEEFAHDASSSSEYIQQYLPAAHVVKTLNHVAYNELEEHSLPAGSSKRRAIGLAGDDMEAKQVVMHVINDLGFDPVDLGNLKAGTQLQPENKLFNTRYTKQEMEKYLYS